MTVFRKSPTLKSVFSGRDYLEMFNTIIDRKSINLHDLKK